MVFLPKLGKQASKTGNSNLTQLTVKFWLFSFKSFFFLVTDGSDKMIVNLPRANTEGNRQSLILESDGYKRW
jgi:hypothetical protein